MGLAGLDVVMGGVSLQMRAAQLKHGSLGTRDPMRRLAILTEEVGEVARALLAATKPNASLRCRADLRDELQQVASVALHWLIAMEDEDKERIACLVK